MRKLFLLAMISLLTFNVFADRGRMGGGYSQRRYYGYYDYNYVYYGGAALLILDPVVGLSVTGVYALLTTLVFDSPNGFKANGENELLTDLDKLASGGLVSPKLQQVMSDLKEKNPEMSEEEVGALIINNVVVK